MRTTFLAIVVAIALSAAPAQAGEWHGGANNLCTDCHTMHFSMQHDWNGASPVSPTVAKDGNWLGTTGPNNFLLKLPPNQLCLACHDGQTFAPDVLEDNTNAASYAGGREGGALNETGAGAGYETYKGHTLGSTAVPPGYDPTRVGLAATWYNGTTEGLECIHCHTQHGITTSYRNLGPRALGSAPLNGLPTYAISTTNDNTKDVWVNIATGYAANSGDPTTFGPYYSNNNVSFNRGDRTVGTTQTSNGIDTVCGACHGNFHGGPTDTTIADSGTIAALDGFIRHPTGGIVMGAAGAAGYGGHSSLSRYVAATAKVKTYADDKVGYTDAAPGCVSCHKAHGNQNPFGLVFLSRTALASAVTEEGANGTELPPTGAAPTYMRGYRNLCGQCHTQGN